MDYMAKIDKKDYAKWLENNKEYNGRLMFQLWVDHLSDEKNFEKFHETIKDSEMERSRDNFVYYKLRDLDAKNWSNFLINCRSKGMYGNDMVNILIKRFNSDGFCIETCIKV